MAAEPASTGTGALLLAASAAALGPLLGEYVVIIVCALGGSLVAVTATPPISKMAGFGVILRGGIVAAVMTGLMVKAGVAVTGWHVGDLVGPVALLIGWRTEWALGWLQNRIGGPNGG